jgi:hypothetical protein
MRIMPIVSATASCRSSGNKVSVAGKWIARFGATCALGFMLSACSLAGPASHSFTTATATPAKPDPTALEQASAACKESTRDKGIKSVLAIISRMRPGAVDADYVECMKKRGYAVEK